jgi:hypothetical protein
MKASVFAGIALSLLLTSLPVQAADYVRLYTQWQGSGQPLDIYNGGPHNNMAHLAPRADVSGQFWSIRPDGDWVRLTTQFRGDDMCLDIVNGGERDGMAHLVPCANYSGQFWQMQ